jgi:hypothetical protein
MKKIIAIFTLILAFGFNANAQQTAKKAVKTETKEELIKRSVTRDVEELTSTVTMDESLKHDLTILIEMRAQDVFGSENEKDRKSKFDGLTYKIIGGLNPEQLEQLKRNEALYKRLTQYQSN